jgi:hypothetical protein
MPGGKPSTAFVKNCWQAACTSSALFQALQVLSIDPRSPRLSFSAMAMTMSGDRLKAGF